MFAEMEYDSCRIVAEMDMEMIIEERFFVADIIEEDERERDTSDQCPSGHADTS